MIWNKQHTFEVHWSYKLNASGNILQTKNTQFMRENRKILCKVSCEDQNEAELTCNLVTKEKKKK